MTALALQSLTNLPAFAAYFGLAMALLAAFLVIYVRITPYREFALIRAGNVAAAASLSGAMAGFVVALGSAIAHSVSLPDMLIWAAVAVVGQRAVRRVCRLHACRVVPCSI